MNGDKQTVVSEKTLVPLSFLFLILVGVLRVESTSFRANANAEAILEIKDERAKIADELKKHGEALARIEGALGTNKQSQNQVAK